MDDTLAEGSEASEHGKDAIPKRLGRYRVRRLIGAGQMGVVFEAWDPDLERVRAIKLMQPARREDAARTRFLREARAMARLDHPNVVSVQDVGVFRGRVFVVMDLVDGPTLRAWLTASKRSWSETLARFIAAGRGLLAAHEAGLVHRDFKPDNVLVTDDGATKVTDFGLVREQDEPGGTEAAAADELHADALTRTGALLGTPAYLPPERFRGELADARGDMYSFCVALYEALYGQHPFVGDTLNEKMAEITAGNIRTPPDHAEVPGWIFGTIQRGMNPEPSERYASMAELLAALDQTPRRRRRWWMLGVATVVLAAVALSYWDARDRVRAWLDPVVLEPGIAQAKLVEPMELVADSEVGPYVRSPVANKGRAAFELHLPRRGRYHVWGLVWEPKLGGDRGDSDSFLVYVDDGAEHLWHIGCQNEVLSPIPGPGHWRWQQIHEMPNADSDCIVEPFFLELTAGPHELVVRNREEAPTADEAVRLARLVITDDPDWTPPDPK